METNHILISGPCGAGKTELVNRLLAGCPVPVYGFRDVKKSGENKYAKLLKETGTDGIIAMDELQCSEIHSVSYCAFVFRCFDGDVPVIATCENPDAPGFMKELTEHPKIDVFALLPGGADALYEKLAPRVQDWITELTKNN